MAFRSRSARRAVVAALIALAPLSGAAPASLAAQVHGGGPVYRAPAAWWLSGGVNTASSAYVNDAASGGRWRFVGDPVFFARGSIERAVGVTTTLGISGFYGSRRARFTVLQPELVDPAPETPASQLACFTVAGCDVNVETFGASLVLRGGGGSAQDGIYQILEFEAGVLGFREVSLAADATPFRTTLRVDPLVSAGFGFGYALTDRLHVSFVQSVGLAFGRGEPLPEDVRSSYEFRSSRVTLRWGLGSRGF